ncbi:MAG TPA: RNA methyltransferase [Terriglobales bacterium]|nr:RNA methyltransferase [Terriglobales bacterium]
MPSSELDRLRKITSRQNSQVKELRHAFQQAETTSDGYCAIEGIRLIEEAIRSGLRFKAVFFRQSAHEQAERLLPQLSTHLDTLLLPDDVFDGAVDTETPQGVAALVRLRDYKLEQVLARPVPFLMGAVGIQDPGNLGTIIRSSEAFGADALLAAEKTVKRFNPKVIRASAGSLFRLPVLDWSEEDLGRLREKSIKLVATTSHKGEDLDAVDLTGPLAVFIGGEGTGLPRAYMAQMQQLVRIPQSERVESLNAGVAASIVLYEAARQRKKLEGATS